MRNLKIPLMIVTALVIVTLSRSGLFQKPDAEAQALLTDARQVAPTGLGDLPPAADGIRFLQERIKHNPSDAVSLTMLGQLYLRQARLTGDVANYQRAEAALQQALTLLPGYTPAKLALASTWYAQHNFVEALELAQQLYQNDPRRMEALAIIGDARLALGNYKEAETAYRGLLSSGATPPALARLAHQAELHGRPEEALQLLQRAAGETLAAGQAKEELAWYLIRLGDLYFNRGQLKKAGEHYAAALRLVDHYYLALAGLGKVRAAEGQYDEAINLYQQATAIIPQPELLAALGDLYILTNRPDQAQRQYDTVEYIGQLAQINQRVYNRQLALFYADHDLHLAEALALATAELDFRRDIYGFDAAAWAYYKNGRLDEAQATMEQAMQLGTRDAKLFYHAGMIAQAQGRDSQAKAWLAEALAINPHFDLLQARVAQAALKQLPGEQ